MNKKVFPYRNAIVTSFEIKRKFRDLSTQEFDNLKVIKPIGTNKNGFVVYLCECKCGGTLLTICSNLNSGRHRSCGCIKNMDSKKGERLYRRIPDDKFSCLNAIYLQYKKQSIHRDIEFNLSKSDVENFIFKNCHYCDSEPLNYYTRLKKQHYYNGIDRKNNNIGYTVDNCVTCCKNCNFMKSSLSVTDFINHIIKIYTKTIKI